MSGAPREFDRRSFLAAASGTMAGIAAAQAIAKEPRQALAAGKNQGLVVTEPEAAKCGMEILKSGGNAVDAAVAAALVAGVVNASKCGIGGYGGHMVIALPDGEVKAIDFNSAAPVAARPDMFPVDDQGKVKGDVNRRGWLAAGVPGTLAGLQRALDNYGTLPFAAAVQPAIRFARDGFPVPLSYLVGPDSLRGKLPFVPRNGKPFKKGDAARNPHLADMLQELAESGSVEPFYRGKIGERIAEAFQKNGGLVTAEDMKSYQALEVAPLVLEWRGYAIATAPLTAGGLTILQAIAALKSLRWEEMSLEGPARTQAWLEALRIAWGDRLHLFGDPRHVDVPVKHLLSEQYSQQSAAKITTAIANKHPVPVATDSRTAGGTVHVSAADADGMMVSLTLTHGEAFGAQVTVDGLGLILGHGMSRFDPTPGRPNSIAPGKRPLNNMCPTILLRDGRPVAALGGTGGRRIPNAVFQVLLSLVGEGRRLQESIAAPRVHTEGGVTLHAEPRWRESEVAYLKQIGYRFAPPRPSFVYAVQRVQATAQRSETIGAQR